MTDVLTDIYKANMTASTDLSEAQINARAKVEAQVVADKLKEVDDQYAREMLGRDVDKRTGAGFAPDKEVNAYLARQLEDKDKPPIQTALLDANVLQDFVEQMNAYDLPIKRLQFVRSAARQAGFTEDDAGVDQYVSAVGGGAWAGKDELRKKVQEARGDLARRREQIQQDKDTIYRKCNP